MDKYLLNIIKKYYNILSYVGSINPKEYNRLIILIFLQEFTSSGIELSKQDYEDINELLQKLDNCSSLITNIPKVFPKNKGNSDYGKIVIVNQDNKILLTENSNTNVAIDSEYSKFSDFNYKDNTNFDVYLVGYDESENSNIKINASDLGTYWVEDD